LPHLAREKFVHLGVPVGAHELGQRCGVSHGAENHGDHIGLRELMKRVRREMEETGGTGDSRQAELNRPR
jgi:hypothetical protein